MIQIHHLILLSICLNGQLRKTRPHTSILSQNFIVVSLQVLVLVSDIFNIDLGWYAVHAFIGCTEYLVQSNLALSFLLARLQHLLKLLARRLPYIYRFDAVFLDMRANLIICHFLKRISKAALFDEAAT